MKSKFFKVLQVFCYIMAGKRQKGKKKVPQEGESKKEDEKVFHSKEETKNNVLSSKGETPVKEKKQNVETKGPLESKNSSTDHSKVEISKPAPQKSPLGKNFCDDLPSFTKFMNMVNEYAKKQTQPYEISINIRLKEKKKDPQECEGKNGNENVFHFGKKKTESIEFTFKSETPENKRKQNAETKGPLESKNSSTDHSKDDSSKPVPQKSPSEKNISDDITPITVGNKNLSNSAISMKTAGCMSLQERLKQIRDESLRLAAFLSWCNLNLYEMSSLETNDKLELLQAMFDLQKEVEIGVENFHKHKIPSESVMKLLQKLLTLLNKIKEPVVSIRAKVNMQTIRAIQARFRILGGVCHGLSNAYRKFADGAEVSFSDGSDKRWKGLKKGIELDICSASYLLKNCDETNVVKIEEIVEKLNADVGQFAGELLKVEGL